MQLKRRTATAAVLCGLCLIRVAASQPPDKQTPALPNDLRLSANDVAQCEALSNFAWGLFLQQEGKVPSDRFQKHYLAALQSMPESPILLKHLVTPWLFARKFGRIIDALTPIAEAHPNVPHLQLVLSQALLAEDRTDEAEHLLKRALIASNWEDDDLLRELFLCHWRKKRLPAIAKLLREARRHAKDHARLVVEQTYIAYYDAICQPSDDTPALSDRQKKRYQKKAVGHAEKAIALLDEHGTVEQFHTMAALLMRLEAWELLEEMVEEARGDSQERIPELDLLLVETLQNQEREEEALPLLGKLIQPPPLQPRFFSRIAQAYLSLNRPTEAATFFERALIAFPRAVELRFRLGYVYLRLSQPQNALQVLEKLKRLPAEGHFMRSHALKQLNKLKAAARELTLAEEQAVKSKNEGFFSVDFYLFFATLCEELKLPDRSIEKARKALELDPEDPVCANFLGYVLADHNRNLAEAELLVRKALERDPENYAYLDSMAWVYYRQGRFPEALAAIDRTLRFAEEDPDPIIIDHAGDIYAANGLWLLAEKCWREALVSGAENQDDIRGKIKNIPTLP